MALITAADPGDIVEPVDLTAVDVRTIHPALTPEACLRSMHAVSAAGRVAAGFDAVRSIAGRLPLFWPFAAIAHLPGVASLGRRRVQSPCGHSAARRPLHRRDLRNPFRDVANRASSPPRPRPKPPQPDHDPGRLPGGATPMNYASSPFADSRPAPDEPDDDDREAFPHGRMFLAEPGWRIGVKTGSDREFCYMMAPGQDFYHRLLDGEVFLHRARGEALPGLRHRAAA